MREGAPSLTARRVANAIDPIARAPGLAAMEGYGRHITLEAEEAARLASRAGA